MNFVPKSIYWWCIAWLATFMMFVMVVTPATAELGTGGPENAVIAMVPGNIIDFDLNRILYKREEMLYIRDRANQKDVNIPLSTGAVSSKLTANGAIFQANSNINVWEVSGGVKTIATNTGDLFSGSRNYAVFSTRTLGRTAYEIWLYNLIEGTFHNVSANNRHNAGQDFATVSNDGHLMYKNETDELIAYYDGVTTKTSYHLPGDETDAFYHGHATDGIQLVFKHWLADSNVNSLNIYRDGIEQQLDVFHDDIRDYRVNNGWLAYVSNRRSTDGIVLMAPTGTKLNIPFPNSETNIRYLSDSGDIVFSDDQHLWYTGAEMNGRLVLLAQDDFGMFEFESYPFLKMEDGHRYGFIGSNLYRFTPERSSLVLNPAQGTVGFDPKSLARKVSEGSATLYFDVYRDGSTLGELTVNYTTKAKTATANMDFKPVEGSITFKSGMRKAVIQIRLINDTVQERDESFAVKLLGQAEQIQDKIKATANVIIKDND